MGLEELETYVYLCILPRCFWYGLYILSMVGCLPVSVVGEGGPFTCSFVLGPICLGGSFPFVGVYLCVYLLCPFCWGWELAVFLEWLGHGAACWFWQLFLKAIV